MSKLSSLNFRRGFNRITIVAATVLALFGYNFGADLYEKRNSTDNSLVFTDEFISYIKEYYNVEIDKTIATKKTRSRVNPFMDITDDDSIRSTIYAYPELVKSVSLLSASPVDLFAQDDLVQQFKKMRVPKKKINLYFKHDPLIRYDLDFRIKGQKADVWDWIRFVPASEDIIFAGVISTIATFFIAYLSIHVLFRLIRWLVEGFKIDNKKT